MEVEKGRMEEWEKAWYVNRGGIKRISVCKIFRFSGEVISFVN